MKKYAIRFAASCLTVILLALCGITVSAEKYSAKIVSESFSSASSCKFLQPGDINKNGVVNADDMVLCRKNLLGLATETASAYYDVNGDAANDVRDLVRQKKITSSGAEFIVDGAMVLNGNSIYSGEFVSVMGTGAEYTITLSYVSDSGIKIKINGFGEEKVFSTGIATELKTVTFSYKTPLSKSDTLGVELQVIGVGSVSDLSVTRINMDNVFEEVW